MTLVCVAVLGGCLGQQPGWIVEERQGYVSREILAQWDGLEGELIIPYAQRNLTYHIEGIGSPVAAGQLIRLEFALPSGVVVHGDATRTAALDEWRCERGDPREERLVHEDRLVRVARNETGCTVDIEILEEPRRGTLRLVNWIVGRWDTPEDLVFKATLPRRAD